MNNCFIVPFDGSAYALKALEYAIRLGKGIDAEIVLVNVQPNYGFAPNVKKFFSAEEIKEYQQQTGRDVLAPALERLRDASIKYSTSIRSGIPAVEICNEAKERGASGIFMGSRGLGPIRGAILGSVSYGVLHNAPCPVTIVS